MWGALAAPLPAQLLAGRCAWGRLFGRRPQPALRPWDPWARWRRVGDGYGPGLFVPPTYSGYVYFPSSVRDTLTLPSGCYAKAAWPEQGWGWETSSRLCPGNGPLALLVTKGINLQHRQVLGHGTRHLLEMPQLGESRAVMHKLPQMAASAAPPAHWGPDAAPLSHATLCPMDCGGLQGSVSVSVSSWPVQAASWSGRHSDLAPMWC